MSKAEGEVTTGEADLLREIDEHYKRGNQPVEGDYNTQSLLWFSDGNQLLRRCRAMIEEQAREIAEDDMEITSLCNEADELRVVNASLRAKLDERDAELYTLQHLTWHMLDDSEQVDDSYIVDRTDVEAVWALLPEGHPQPRQSAQAASQPSNPET